jgi:TIR domain
LVAWLQKQPPEVSVALAARAALCVVPLLQEVVSTVGGIDVPQQILSAVFRATAVAWNAAAYNAHTPSFTSAARAARAFAETGAASGVRAAPFVARAAVCACDATLAALSGAQAARDAGLATASAVRAFDTAVFFGTGIADSLSASDATIAAPHKSAFWSAVSIDAAGVDQHKTASEIAGSPLWPNGQPAELRSLWQELKVALPAAGEDWQVWIEWYEDRLAGHVRDEERELAYVRIGNELWDKGPAIVNAEIKRRIEAHAAPIQDHAVLAVESKGTADSAVSNRVVAAKTGFAATKRPAFKGFFSYTHRDAEVDPHIIEAFSSELEKRVDAKLVNARFEIWRDKEKLQLGDYWDQRIGAAIDTSHIFIILLTPKWISSDYCRKEFEAFQKIEAARDSGGYIIPIYARDIERQAKFLEAEQKELLDHLKRIQYQQIIPKQFARLSDNERIDLIEGIADPICDILDRLRG